MRAANEARTTTARQHGPVRGIRAVLATRSARGWRTAISVVGWPISPGLYAGRIGDRIKIGQSMNVAQRADTFKFEELIGVKPLVPAAPRADEHANEWFRLDDELIRVLFEEGRIVARARVRPALGTRFGRAFWSR